MAGLRAGIPGAQLTFSSITQRWRTQSLTRQFLLAGGVVMFVASVLAGLVVGRYVEDNALYHRAAATALFLDSVVAPLLQSLSRKDLGADDKLHLDALWNNVDLATRIPHFEVWLADGTVAYTNGCYD